jgi:hypothetical protein
MMKENRMCFAGIGTPEDDDIRLLDFLIGIRPATCSENRRQTGDAWSMSGTVAAVDVIAAHDDARKFLRDEVHFVCRLRATEHAERSGGIVIDRGSQTGNGAVQRFIPCRRPEGCTAFLFPNKRLREANVWLAH